MVLLKKLFPVLLVRCVVKDACEVEWAMRIKEVMFVDGCDVVNKVSQARCRVLDVCQDVLVLLVGELMVCRLV